MGAFDRAEVCKLVTKFLLHKLSQKFNKTNVGLYHDDGLSIFKNISGPESEKVKKQFVIQFNMNIVNYLAVLLNLESSTYRPYLKENNLIRSIYTESNHPTIYN